ncbi:halocyanin domain-containing protein [Halomarina rubra]|uniref:Halocyanin domain-containing protein n=1 Tax=Halomarina rubra TaxID=2071873 RepID=A0ABD6AXH3_9EURY|nr:halocyanin domain-containing protein [Halomarina rubra]
MSTHRRGVLKALALVAVLVTAILAGCTSGTADEGAAGLQLPNEPDYKGYLDNTDNYDYTHDMRGQEAVTIEVGSKGNMGDYGFGPAAVAVSPGTTVTWVWTGSGGTHNVVADEGTFNSGPPVAEKGTTFEYTFDKPGVYRYACEPHEAMGMKGAIFVTPDQSGGPSSGAGAESGDSSGSESIEYSVNRHLELGHRLG